MTEDGSYVPKLGSTKWPTEQCGVGTKPYLNELMT